MKERPILFSAPRVKAILAGTKTQTRRVVNLPKVRGEWEPCMVGGPGVFSSRGETIVEMASIFNRKTGHIEACPYGNPGDRLWVRETWCHGRGLAFVASRDILCAPAGAAPAPGIVYRADNISIPRGCHWRPSIHMPRWASRITLEITGVRVERVRDISETDLAAEGYTGIPDRPSRKQFQESWDATYAKRGQGWDVNPWVWVVAFKRIGEAKGDK